MEPADVLGAGGLAFAAYDCVRDIVAELGPCEVRTTKSQVAFRRRRGFAYLWLPPAWAPNRADVVLSIALDREIASPRWKQVARPTSAVWMHHLEVRNLDDLDDEVRDWLRQAFDAAG